MLNKTSILIPAILSRFEETYRQMVLRPHLAQVAAMFTDVSSNKSGESYAWLADIPEVQEWIGTKSLKGLKDYKYSIQNKDFYAGFSFDRNEMEDEQISSIMPRVDMTAMKVANHKMDLLIDLLKNGTTELAYDGVAFFSNARTGTDNDNLLTGTGTTLAQFKADLATARAKMMRFTSESGKPMGLVLDTIVCAPEFELTVLEAIRSSSLVTNGEGTLFNPISNWVQNVITLPELTDTNDWYGLCTSFPLKPFIFQTRKPPVAVVDEGEVKDSRLIKVSAEMRGNAGFGFYQMAVKVTNT